MRDTELQNRRLIAAAIDFGVAVALAVVMGIVTTILNMFLIHSMGTAALIVAGVMNLLTSLVSLAYMLGRDLLGGDRSLGKKFQNIRIVADSGTVGPMESVKRNLIFAVGSIFVVIWAVLGLVPCLGNAVRCILWPLFIFGWLLSLVAVAVEIVKIFQDPDGIRFGDQFAGTRVMR
jgi:hypothetical protein